MLTKTREDVQVWSAAGVPVRLVWRGERFRVVDEPTRHDGGLLFDAWRFVARSDIDHRTVVMDVEQVDGQWSLVATYE